MNFSFGIFTSDKTNIYVKEIIESIIKLKIPKYEIIVVGGDNLYDDNIIHVEFDESVRPNWLNRKKNIFIETSKYENLVFLHDYQIFNENWFIDFLEFGNDFDICATRVINADGSRYRDWILCWDAIPEFPNGLPNKEHILPYSEKRLSKFMYINGSYWIAKRSVMIEFPLDPELVWGQSEDIVWSKKVTKKYKFDINKKSTLIMLKHKDPFYNYMSDHTYNSYILPFIEKNKL